MVFVVLQCDAVCCSALQCVAVCCRALQCVAACCKVMYLEMIFVVLQEEYQMHLYTLHHTASHCNTLQYTATHCNTLQHTATHCNADLGVTVPPEYMCSITMEVMTHLLQHTATHCSTLQHTATHCNTLQRRFRSHGTTRVHVSHHYGSHDRPCHFDRRYLCV